MKKRKMKTKKNSQSQDFERCHERISMWSKKEVNKLFVNWNLVYPTTTMTTTTMRRIWKCVNCEQKEMWACNDAWADTAAEMDYFDVFVIYHISLINFLFATLFPFFFSFCFAADHFQQSAFHTFSDTLRTKTDFSAFSIWLKLDTCSGISIVLFGFRHIDWHCTIIYLRIIISWDAQHRLSESINHFNNDNSARVCFTCRPYKWWHRKQQNTTRMVLRCYYYYFFSSKSFCHIFHFFLSLPLWRFSMGFLPKCFQQNEHERWTLNTRHNFLDICGFQNSPNRIKFAFVFRLNQDSRCEAIRHTRTHTNSNTRMARSQIKLMT